jgi:hypothetical protein
MAGATVFIVVFLVQRVILISFLGWLFTVAARQRHIAAGEGPPPADRNVSEA